MRNNLNLCSILCIQIKVIIGNENKNTYKNRVFSLAIITISSVLSAQITLFCREEVIGRITKK